MKPPSRSTFVVVILLLLAGWIFRDFLWPSTSAQTANATSSEQVKSATSQPTDKSLLTKKAEELRSLVLSSDAGITFFGRVEDQDGKPIANAKVDFSVIKTASAFPSLGLPGGASGSVSTDADGNFLIKNQRGSSINIGSIGKEGYTEAKRNVRSYSYGDNAEPHRPDSKSPELFVLIANQGRAAILTSNVVLPLNWNGPPSAVSIPFPDSQVVIDFFPTRQPKQTGKSEFTWSLKIKPRGAQILLTKNGGPEIAPTDGYSRAVTLGFEESAQRWSYNASGVMYLKLDIGEYVRAVFNIYSDGDNSEPSGRLDGFLNPSGGRYFK